MRLNCPDCSAQYEIDASLIPAEGRDVQCSNCGHTWFQDGVAPATAAAVEDPAPATTEGQAWPRPQPALDDPEDDDDEVFAAEADEDATDAEETAPVAEAPRREIDPLVRNILKEEAERELSQRASEPAFESQRDMDLAPAAAAGPSAAWRARVSRIEDGEALQDVHLDDEDDEIGDESDVAAAAPPPKRVVVSRDPARTDAVPSDRRRSDLLPDIEDINSSLTSRPPEDAEAQAEERRSFVTGFAASLAAAVALLMLYMYAPQIASALPATEGFLVSYVGAANEARDGLASFFGS